MDAAPQNSTTPEQHWRLLAQHLSEDVDHWFDCQNQIVLSIAVCFIGLWILVMGESNNWEMKKKILLTRGMKNTCEKIYISRLFLTEFCATLRKTGETSFSLKIISVREFLILLLV